MKKLLHTFILVNFLMTINYGQGVAPSINKEWTVEEYLELSNYLDDLPTSDFPTLSNKNRLLKKAISSISQPILENRDYSLSVRMRQAINFQKAITQILNKYNKAHEAGTNYSTELSYLTGLLLSMSNQVIKVVNEFIPTLDPNNQRYKAQVDGLQIMRNGMAGQMDGVLLSLEEINGYTDEERKIIAKYFAENGFEILNFTEEDYRSEFILNLKSHLASENNEEIRETLQPLLAILEQ